MKHSITKIMLTEHARILSLLEKFYRTDSAQAKELFNKLKWNLEKHFFIEEKVIFEAYKNRTEEENEYVFRILQEHQDIFGIVKKIESSFSSDSIIGLKEILQNHAKFEENSFYPKLDEELDENLKEMLVERANEVLIG